MTDAQTVLIGVSEAIRQVEDEVVLAARSTAKILITGESGVGKEIVARSIHRLSHRAKIPMVTINCAGIPDSLLESELFGHVRGSFTSAYTDRTGRLESAHGSTVFLDEVGEMSLRMQALFLRFLETGEIQRVGAMTALPTRVDARVIAATNRDLTDGIRSRRFREDLYYRLNVIHIMIPPLRTRREDIPVLLRHFFAAYANRYEVAPPSLSPQALEQLVAYEWPGNVRELKNIVERLTVRAGVAPISTDEVVSELRKGVDQEPASRPQATSIVDSLMARMVEGGETFWSAVYPLFMARDLTRNQVRQLVEQGLQRTAGSYRILIRLFNLAPGEYKRFLSFLRTHGCDLSFQVYREVKCRYPSAERGRVLAVANDRSRRTVVDMPDSRGRA